ncbi:MAG: acylphosphatase [Longimicrobiales bacterium]
MKQPRRNTEARLHFALYGAVQGVGFRYFVRTAARPLDLAGYVLNRSDGAVEIEAEGSPDAVQQLLHTVQHGPPLANVERVERLGPSAETLPKPFEIRH